MYQYTKKKVEYLFKSKYHKERERKNERGEGRKKEKEMTGKRFMYHPDFSKCLKKENVNIPLDHYESFQMLPSHVK